MSPWVRRAGFDRRSGVRTPSSGKQTSPVTAMGQGCRFRAAARAAPLSYQEADSAKDRDESESLVGD